MYFWRTFTIIQKKSPEIEMFKVNNGLSVQSNSECFHFAENHYNVRPQLGTKFKADHVKTKTYGK